MRAIRDAATKNDQAAVPALINRLDSDDPAERLLAQRALEKLTGQSCGYDHAASRQDRQAAVQRWVAWYQQERLGRRLVGGVGVLDAQEHNP